VLDFTLCRAPLLQLYQSLFSGFLLRLFFGFASPVPKCFAAHGNFSDETLIMSGTALRDQTVNRRSAKEHLTDLLQSRLVILLAEFFVP